MKYKKVKISPEFLKVGDVFYYYRIKGVVLDSNDNVLKVRHVNIDKAIQSSFLLDYKKKDFHNWTAIYKKIPIESDEMGLDFL